jgi:hypothetical protein
MATLRTRSVPRQAGEIVAARYADCRCGASRRSKILSDRNKTDRCDQNKIKYDKSWIHQIVSVCNDSLSGCILDDVPGCDGNQGKVDYCRSRNCRKIGYDDRSPNHCPPSTMKDVQSSYCKTGVYQVNVRSSREER